MGRQPVLGAFDQIEDGFVGGLAFEFGVAGFLPYPGNGVGAVRIDGQGGFVGGLQS